MAAQVQHQRDVPFRGDASRAVSDMRRHRRLALTLSGRFMRADRSEYDCTLRDISVGGASIVTATRIEIGERIVAYFEHVGGFEGTITRILPDGFALQFKISEHKREKLAAQIMWLVNRHWFPDETGRSHERLGKLGQRAALLLEDGVSIDTELLDISPAGASLGTPARPPLGSTVFIDGIRAIVLRHHANGFGVKFHNVLAQEALRTKFQ